MKTASKFALMMVAIVGMLVVLGYVTRPAGSTYTPSTDVPVAPAVPDAPAYDQQQCDQIRAQMDVNSRLAQDGYAQDYSSQYESLLRAAGCP